MSDVLFQSWIMLGRNYRLSLRNVDGLVTGLALPVLLMFVFVFLFGGAIDTGTAYVNYVLPAVILLSASFGAASTAVSVSADLKDGMVDRLRSMPIVSWSFLAGHVGASLVRNLVATALVVGRRGPHRVPPDGGSDRVARSPSACYPCSSSRSRGSPPPSGCSRAHPRPPADTPSSPCSSRTSAAGSSRSKPFRRGCRASPSTSR